MGLSASTARPAKAPPSNIPEGAEKATLAAGCFWGVEHIFRKHFKDAKDGGGLYDARVGYTGGDKSNPSYRQVCSGTTGHAEALQLIYNPSRITYRELIEFFYRIHDPTTKNAQGNDHGTQYRSAIFTHSAEQDRIAREVTQQVKDARWFMRRNRMGVVVPEDITTQIVPAGKWYDAEGMHQEYLTDNPYGYQCPTHFVRGMPPLPPVS
ncbi:peptide methionine sulfoxide reductase MsrA [Microdochium trichocladiopsis]|uniref:peptide-methionine (S)-S-oxide reductase n=1 Tax=Microdochium trichocladiopsis TaxID=1682393 RepID=A0A9P9BIM0_9PEZI|nr:peptide methionine sulfoxide reductase MsrA [Microdochium trichocladiopsis]KAH7014490.1 peptide methionine sulfoxide reductase MsrA [Microdochium trichocladiopsis]